MTIPTENSQECNCLSHVHSRIVSDTQVIYIVDNKKVHKGHKG